MNIWAKNPMAEAMARWRAGDGELATAAATKETSEFVKSMRPIVLDEDREAEYENFFYNTAAKGSRRDFLIPTLEAIADLTYNVNLFFEFMRQCVKNSGRISRAPEDQAQEIVLSLFDQAFGLKSKSGESVQTSVQNFLRATRISSGAFHNVYRSVRYPDGVDVLLNSSGNDANVKWPTFFGSSQKNDFSLMANHQSSQYFVEQQKRDLYQTPFGSNVLIAAKEITEYLFGSSAISERPIHQGLNLSTKFSQVQSIFERHTGMRLPQELVPDLQINNILAEQFLQVEFMKMPSERAQTVAADIRQTYRTASPTDSNAMINNRFSEGQLLSKEAELLNVVARSTLRFTLESDIARFVSQNSPSEPASLSRVNTWFTQYIGQILRASSSRAIVKKGIPAVANVATVKVERIPRYAMGASTLKKLSDIRAANGFVVEKTKGNAEGLYIMPNGAFGAKPDVDAVKQSTLAENYEKLSDEILELLSRNGISLAEFQNNPKPSAFPYIEAGDIERLAAMLKELKTYDGVVIGFDWDFGVSITASDEPGVTTTRQEIGAVKPDALTIADYLGYNLAREGEKPMIRNFATSMYMLTETRHASEVRGESERMYGGKRTSSMFSNSTVAQNICALYTQLAYQDKKVPQLQEIIKNSMRALGMDILPKDDSEKDFCQEYLDYLKPDGTILPSQLYSIGELPRILLSGVMKIAAGPYNGWLWKQVIEDLGGNAPYDQVQEEMQQRPEFFDPMASTTADFAKLYNYLGGQVWKQVLDAINSVPVGEHYQTKGAPNTRVDVTPADAVGDIRAEIYLTRRSNAEIMKILPYTQMLGNYAANHETIFAQADEYVESIRADESFSSEDIKVPGMVSDARAVFPHQASVQSYLRKPVPPAFAILALDPGGGKTGQGVIDMSCMVQDMKDIGGGVVKPLVICPNGLINQWCDDIKYFLGHNWNAFPLSADVMKRWGQDKLLELAAAAPPNTIFIASMTFIQGRAERLCIGNAMVNVSSNMEFVRRLGCSYIAIDESHNLKSFASARHRAVKVLTTATTVKWKRILTGTIMPDRAKDIEGQIALHSPAIFRAGEIASIGPNDDGDQVRIGSNVVAPYTPLNAKRAVDKLSHYAAFIVKKRKEWAFMLPAPIEHFYAIGMADTDNNDGTSPEELDLQRKHIQLYEHVLKETEDAIAELMKDKAKAQKAAEDADKNGEEDEDDSDEEKGNGGGGKDLTDNDSDFSGEKIRQQLWEKNLQRFERLIMSPHEDEAFEQIFGSKDVKFIPRKVKTIINLVHQHFHTPAWKQGATYSEYDLVSEGSALYVAKKYDDGANYVQLPASTRDTPPSKNPDYWKLEPEGKLIIITRYNRSARAVYNALDPIYQKQTSVFTGDEPDKKKAFNEFKTNPDRKILIANEQGMSEGHNLQIASRIIRAESPWGPGALSQTNARVFRPDPKGAIAASKGEGEMVRDVIYLDWVLANNTMEVPKLARVISKSFGITRFTEADNPLYKDVLKRKVPTEREEPALSLGIEMLRSTLGLDDDPFKKMRYAYQELNTVENAEFKKMRSEQEAKLLPIEAAPNVEGAARMEVIPFVANQPIPDPNGWNPQNLEEMLRDPQLAENPDQLKGTNVITEYGPGRVVSVKSSKGNVTSVKIRFKNPPVGFNEWQSISPNLVYAATTVSPQDFAKHFDVPLDANETERKKADRDAERMRRQEEEQREQEEREEAIRKKQEAKRISITKKDREDGEKRAKNEKEGKPLNDGIYETKDAVIKIAPKGTKVIVDEEEPDIGVVVEDSNAVRLTPAYYHGFATLEAEMDDAVDPRTLKALGFNLTTPYAFIEVSNKKKFHAFYEFLDNNFDLSEKTVDMISGINDAFEKGMKNTHKLWYKLELAPVAQLPSFFATNKRMVKNRNEVRVFPVFMDNRVMLCIDIRTNPAIIPYVGKTIPGTGAKLTRSEGHWFYFGKNKTALREMIATVKRNGYNVVNQKEAIKELTEIQFKYKK